MSTIKINLTKLTGACVRTLTGKTGTAKPCLIIPLDAGLTIEKDSVYLKLKAFELTVKNGQTHFLKREVHPEEHINYNELPVIGGIKE